MAYDFQRSRVTGPAGGGKSNESNFRDFQKNKRGQQGRGRGSDRPSPGGYGSANPGDPGFEDVTTAQYQPKNPLPNEPETLAQPQEPVVEPAAETQTPTTDPEPSIIDGTPFGGTGGDITQPIGSVETSPTDSGMNYTPPPRGPSNTQDRIDELWGYGQGAMANPSRYDSDLVQKGAGVIEDAINRMRDTGMRNLGEHFASRGLTGSSLEGMGVADLEGELGRYGNERAFGLQQDQARTWANDRNSAYGMGANAAGMGQGQDRWQSDADFRDWNAGEGYKRTDRQQDQNQLSLESSMVDRFGPGVLQDMGYVPGGGGQGGPPQGDPNSYGPTDGGGAPGGGGPEIMNQGTRSEGYIDENGVFRYGDPNVQPGPMIQPTYQPPVQQQPTPRQGGGSGYFGGTGGDEMQFDGRGEFGQDPNAPPMDENIKFDRRWAY